METLTIQELHALEQIGEFWDTHSLDDYWDQTQEVEIEVRLSPRRRVILDPELYDQVAAQATAQGIGPDHLVNLWVRDQLRELQETS